MARLAKINGENCEKNVRHFRHHGKNGEKIDGENGKNQWRKWRIFFSPLTPDSRCSSVVRNLLQYTYSARVLRTYILILVL